MRAMIAGAVLCAMLAGCSVMNASAPAKNGATKAMPIGSRCKVQFRRGDALGSAAALPVPPITDTINGAEVGVSGKLLRADADWIVIEENGSGPRYLKEHQLWIPCSAVLLLDFESSK